MTERDRGCYALVDMTVGTLLRSRDTIKPSSSDEADPPGPPRPGWLRRGRGRR